MDALRVKSSETSGALINLTAERRRLGSGSDRRSILFMWRGVFAVAVGSGGAFPSSLCVSLGALGLRTSGPGNAPRRSARLPIFHVISRRKSVECRSLQVMTA